MCPLHWVLLDDRCPFCTRILPTLAVHSRPGYCSACGQWLGKRKIHRSAGEYGFQVYVAAAAGDLLAGFDNKARLSAARFRRNLRVCIQRIASGNALAFAELIHISKTTLRGWLCRETLPRLDVLLRFAFHLGVSVRELLMSRGLHGVDWTAIDSRLSIERRNAKCYRSSESLLDLMRAALHDDDCPSVPELAKRLGYKRPERLRQVSPDLCRLTKRHRACHRTHWWREPGAKRICELDRIRALLEHSLEQDPPISVRCIAAKLGYSAGNAGFIHRCFPDLCQSIAKRQEEWKQRRRGELRVVVAAAIPEEPPPTLHDLSRRLGFQTSTTLRSWVPDLADRLLRERAEHAAREKAHLHAVLCDALHENPAVSLNSVARRLQCSATFLREKHLQLCQAIASRYLRDQKRSRKGR